LERIGAVAYKLNLPAGSSLHPTFHVSQLKPCTGNAVSCLARLPMFTPGGKLRIEPLAVLDRRITKRNSAAQAEILIKWSNLENDEATWEDYENIRDQFPEFKLEDKLRLMDGVLSYIG
jgi:Chromo (CHRromatin Organisation MOdifier) domain